MGSRRVSRLLNLLFVHTELLNSTIFLLRYCRDVTVSLLRRSRLRHHPRVLLRSHLTHRRPNHVVHHEVRRTRIYTVHRDTYVSRYSGHDNRGIAILTTLTMFVRGQIALRAVKI